MGFSIDNALGSVQNFFETQGASMEALTDTGPLLPGGNEIFNLVDDITGLLQTTKPDLSILDQMPGTDKAGDILQTAMQGADVSSPSSIGQVLAELLELGDQDKAAMMAAVFGNALGAIDEGGIFGNGGALENILGGVLGGGEKEGGGGLFGDVLGGIGGIFGGGGDGGGGLFGDILGGIGGIFGGGGDGGGGLFGDILGGIGSIFGGGDGPLGDIIGGITGLFGGGGDQGGLFGSIFGGIGDLIGGDVGEAIGGFGSAAANIFTGNYVGGAMAAISTIGGLFD